MADYGFKSTKKVDGELRDEILDHKMPSVLWSTIVDSHEALNVTLPILSTISDASVFSVPLDYVYPTSSSFRNTTSQGNNAIGLDLARFYSVPQPHTAVLYPNTNTIAIAPSNPSVSELIISNTGLARVNEWGNNVTFTQVLAAPNMEALYSLGVYKGSILDGWLLPWIGQNVFNGNIEKSLSLYAILTPNYRYKSTDWIAVYMTYRKGQCSSGSGEEKCYYYGEAYGYNPYSNSGYKFYGNRYPQFSRYLAIYLTARPPNGEIKTLAELRSSYYFAMGLNNNTMISKYGGSVPISTTSIVTETSPGLVIRPELSATRTRSFVYVTGSVTTDELQQVGMVDGYGFTDGTKTINQNYSNLFLVEQAVVTNVTAPRHSKLGHPNRYGYAAYAWDTPHGELAYSVLYDSVAVPIDVYINSSSPAVVIIDEKTTVPFSFCGFKSSNGRYTHAMFKLPLISVGDELAYSILTTAPQNGLEYLTLPPSEFTSRHLYRDTNTSNADGDVGGGTTGFTTAKFSKKCLIAKTDQDSYGVMVKNKTGYAVYNSTVFVADNPMLIPCSDVTIGIKTGNLSGRSTNEIAAMVDTQLTNGVVGGTFCAIDLALNQNNWSDKDNVDWFTDVTWYSYTQTLLAAVPVTQFVTVNGGVKLNTTMAPIWEWSIKKGDSQTSSTALGDAFFAVLGGVAMAYGYTTLAVQLLEFQVAFTESMNTDAGLAPSTASFLFSEGNTHVYTIRIPWLLE